jgi:transcriptional regulator with XRE-family HTH domain
MSDLTDRAPIARLPEPAERVRLRKLYGATQREVAAHVGVTRQMVNRWERGHSDPTGANRIRYAELLVSWSRTETQISRAVINEMGE